MENILFKSGFDFSSGFSIEVKDEKEKLSNETYTSLCVWLGRDATNNVKQVLVVRNLHDAQKF